MGQGVMQYKDQVLARVSICVRRYVCDQYCLKLFNAKHEMKLPKCESSQWAYSARPVHTHHFIQEFVVNTRNLKGTPLPGTAMEEQHLRELT